MNHQSKLWITTIEVFQEHEICFFCLFFPLSFFCFETPEWLGILKIAEKGKIIEATKNCGKQYCITLYILGIPLKDTYVLEGCI